MRENMWQRYLAWEGKLSHFFRAWSPFFFRLSLGILYVWYGGLKLFGMSPAEELVTRATHWTGVHNFVIFLGVWEVITGICFWVKPWNRLALILFFLQLPGTFLPLFLNPEDCFTVIPFGLTLEGQYIFKNFALIAIAFGLIGTLGRSKQ